MHELKEQALLPQYGGACVRPTHFVDGCEGKTHGVQCQCFGRRSLVSHIHHPNLIAWQGFLCQIVVQQGFEIYRRLQKLQIFFKQINSHILAKVINETDIVGVFSY
jgi:hypothetical protein